MHIAGPRRTISTGGSLIMWSRSATIVKVKGAASQPFQIQNVTICWDRLTYPPPLFMSGSYVDRPSNVTRWVSTIVSHLVFISNLYSYVVLFLRRFDVNEAILRSNATCEKRAGMISSSCTMIGHNDRAQW